MKNVSVHHWRYEDGSTGDDVKGWYCWVFESVDFSIRDWMEKNMKGKYDCTPRFNSGNPMHTILIRDEEDAAFFKLTFDVNLTF